MRNLYRHSKKILIAIALLILLASGWSRTAQGQQPPNQHADRGWKQDAIGLIPHLLPSTAAATSIKPSQYPSLAPSDMAAWSRLTFQSLRDSNWEIYQANGDGSNQTRLTNMAASDITPRFNRGTTRITFVSSRTGSYQIFTMNPDGSNVTQLTSTSANNYNPSWSPDGTKIVFSSYRDGQSEIYRMNADGSQPVRLTANPGYDSQPVWSPDGTKIAFTTDRGTPANTGNRIWVMNTDGSGQTQLSTQIWSEDPNWSPDGTRIAYDADGNDDGWQEIWVMNSNGSYPQYLYQPPEYQTDAWVRSWSPNGQYIAFTRLTWTYIGGNWYWVTAYLDALDTTTGTVVRLSNQGEDWFPDWQTADILAPSSQVSAPPLWQNTSTFNVLWSGLDTGGAGLAAYDVQYRDGLNGVWTDWLPKTTKTWSAFTGQTGHTYFFRIRARDNASNLEAYRGGNGDAVTTIYRYALSGHVLDNRDQPISVAAVLANPAAMNPAFSQRNGRFDLYFTSGNTYNLTVTRNNFGTLPPLQGVILPGTTASLAFYLPPSDNRITDGDFESGTLSNWQAFGEITPTMTTTAHTGNAAVLLGGTTTQPNTGPWRSTLEQSIVFSPALVSGTLSLLYQVVAANPLSDTLQAYLIGSTETMSYALPLTSSGWIHQWWDISAWSAPTATLRIELAQGDKDRLVNVIVDEVSLGSVAAKSHDAYLPLMALQSRPVITPSTDQWNFDVGINPEGIAFDGANMWVANTGSNNVSVIRANDGTPIMTPTIGAYPHAIAFDGTNMWVTHYGNSANTVSVLRAHDGATVMTLTVGTNPAGIAFDGTNMWITNYSDDTVSVLRASDGALVQTLPVSNGPFGIAFDGQNMWVSNYGAGSIVGNTVSVLRASDGQQIMTPTVGSRPLKLAFDGANMWVTNDFSNNVSVLRASDGHLIRTIPVGSRPNGIAFDGTNMWVVNYNDKNVIVLRASDGSLMPTVQAVGLHPTDIAFDGANMWVANLDDNTVSKR